MPKGRSGAAGGRRGDDGIIPEDSEVGFAKLQGEDFEYYMQTYSIVLGRNSKTSEVDVDLASIGGGMSISRLHARIFYDFSRRRFALEVLGKNGCLVEGVLHSPGAPPVNLDSQDLLQIGDKRFYFLLPSRSVFDAAGPVSRQPRAAEYDYDDAEDEEHEEEAEDEEVGCAEIGRSGKRQRRDLGDKHAEVFASAGDVAPMGHSGKKPDTRSRADREADNQQLLQLEEKDVISCVATLLSDLCGREEWLPMEKLHAKLVEIYGNVWHHSRIRRYLTSEDYRKSQTKGRPWYGLLVLLRKYPEQVVINTRPKGRATSEFVSLVSLLS